MTITLLLILGKSLCEAMIHIILIFNLKKYGHQIFQKIHARKKAGTHRGWRKIKEMNLKSQSSEQSLRRSNSSIFGTSRNSSVKVNVWGQHPIQDPISPIISTTFLSTQKETLIVSRLPALAVEEKITQTVQTKAMG